MPDYNLKALVNADVPNDRSKVTLRMDTDSGSVNLTMDVVQFEHFTTALEGVEQHLTALDPVAGQKPGEAIQMRTYIVDGVTVGNAMVNNVPSVALILKAGNTTRAYALNRQIAEAVAAKVTDELPSLDRLKPAQGH
jgi:hypothetical protein